MAIIMKKSYSGIININVIFRANNNTAIYHKGKRPMHQDDITVIIYELNNKASEHMKTKLIKL